MSDLEGGIGLSLTKLKMKNKKEGLDKNAVKLGRKGGIATREKLGKAHYQNIQKLSVLKRKSKNQ